MVTEVREEWWHDVLVMIAAVLFSTEGLVFEQVSPSSVILFPAWVELVKFVRGKWGDAEEGFEEDF